MVDVKVCSVFFFEDASPSLKWTVKTSFNKKIKKSAYQPRSWLVEYEGSEIKVFKYDHL